MPVSWIFHNHKVNISLADELESFGSRFNIMMALNSGIVIQLYLSAHTERERERERERDWKLDNYIITKN